MRTFWLLSAAALLAVVPAKADQTRDALAEFAKCSSIGAVIERLQCYDNAAAAAKMALAAPPGAAQQASVEAESEDEGGGMLSWFGLGASKPVKRAADFGRPPQPVEGPKEITELSAHVTKMSRTALGRAIFTLDNGQVWTQVEGDNAEVRDISDGDNLSVTIEKAMFGSYSLTFAERKGLVKVRRTK